MDAGNDPAGGAVLAALAAHGAGPDAVSAIFLTHGHPDHVAACGQFPRATVYAMAEEVPFATGARAYTGPIPSVLGSTPAPCAVSPLRDGQVVAVGALDVEAFLVPGHTAGSAAYLVGDAMFLGDSLRVRAGDVLSGAPWVFSDDVDRNVAELGALARRTQGRDVRWVLNAHTGSVSGATFRGLAGE